ncbi:MAG: helix-turn-helix transcriptional regulator [Clostridia bacterium]|nr:helix-turn-helix transcriptional regulator [Clostridia bacterium]
MIEFAKNLKRERMLSGLTQKQMAEKLGISYRTYQNYELTTQNNREPDLETLCKIAKILDVNVDYLLGLDII